MSGDHYGQAVGPSLPIYHFRLRNDERLNSSAVTEHKPRYPKSGREGISPLMCPDKHGSCVFLRLLTEQFLRSPACFTL
ncbi:hypothetical protein CEXT_493401 [Caerostris extrusa]|uniref:Uncharacterized protein n=1 Tax=Caerostris extrusa TaxID=172846 RepID=A0AAV4XV71_CAEEX|nr:hypothetical protein CEXT_493401 [Caerostris extrusa]